MLEILTNGHVPALRHRVALVQESERNGISPLKPGRPLPSIERQAHILFLQPDANTWIRPLDTFLRHDGSDRAAVRYGDWHGNKVCLAFGDCDRSKRPQRSPSPIK